MIYLSPLPSGFQLAYVTEYKLFELLDYQDQEYIQSTWEKRFKRLEESKIWISISYDNILRAVNEFLLHHDYNYIKKFRTKNKYMQKHLDKIIARIIEFCKRHNLRKIPKALINELIEYEIERKIIMRNYVRNYKVPYKYK
jgi:uncharacterized membrane-anchored protein YjiN (DUF445 family)